MTFLNSHCRIKHCWFEKEIHLEREFGQNLKSLKLESQKIRWLILPDSITEILDNQTSALLMVWSRMLIHWNSVRALLNHYEIHKKKKGKLISVSVSISCNWHFQHICNLAPILKIRNVMENGSFFFWNCFSCEIVSALPQGWGWGGSLWKRECPAKPIYFDSPHGIRPDFNVNSVFVLRIF